MSGLPSAAELQADLKEEEKEHAVCGEPGNADS